MPPELRLDPRPTSARRRCDDSETLRHRAQSRRDAHPPKPNTTNTRPLTASHPGLLDWTGLLRLLYGVTLNIALHYPPLRHRHPQHIVFPPCTVTRQDLRPTRSPPHIDSAPGRLSVAPPALSSGHPIRAFRVHPALISVVCRAPPIARHPRDSQTRTLVDSFGRSSIARALQLSAQRLTRRRRHHGSCGPAGQ